MKPPLFSIEQSIHFIGVGGIGLSALARYFLALKWAVSGSDLIKSKITQKLQKEGVKVKIGHKKANLDPKTGFVVFSQAVKPNNPELREARRLHIPVLAEPTFIGMLTRTHKTVAVTGAHGKSTTTALAGLILKDAGLDPTIIVGTQLKELPLDNFRMGRSPYLVLEADEWHKKLLNYSPTVAVVTNIDREHMDSYRNLADLKNTFLKFLSQTKSGGALILNRDDKNLWSLRKKITKIAKEKNFWVIWHALKGRTAKKVRHVIKIPGLHNISNAVAAYKVGRVLGVPHRKILASIAKYRGSWRRMEYRGKLQMANSKSHGNKKLGVHHSPLAIRHLPLVYDDYAHHPTEIKATLAAFREKYPRSPVICVFQPHQALRLKILFRDFVNCFREADILILLPLYKVAGRDRTYPRYTSEKLAEAIRQKYPNRSVAYLKNPKNIKKEIIKIVKPLDSKFYLLNSIIVMMGAGDIVNYTDFLIKSRRQV